MPEAPPAAEPLVAAELPLLVGLVLLTEVVAMVRVVDGMCITDHRYKVLINCNTQANVDFTLRRQSKEYSVSMSSSGRS